MEFKYNTFYDELNSITFYTIVCHYQGLILCAPSAIAKFAKIPEKEYLEIIQKFNATNKYYTNFTYIFIKQEHAQHAINYLNEKYAILVRLAEN